MNAAVVALALERTRKRLWFAQGMGAFGMSNAEYELAESGIMMFAEEVIKANIQFTEDVETLTSVTMLHVFRKNIEYGSAENDPLIDGTVDTVIAGMV